MRDSCPRGPFSGFSIQRILAILTIAIVLASASTGITSAQQQHQQVPTLPPPASSSSPPALPTNSTQSFSTFTPDSIFLALFANGDALVEYDILMANATNATATFAGKVKVKLFGTNINELIVTDLDDKILPVKIGTQGEIEITRGNATGARISYLTPDLINKAGRTWTFNLEAPIEVAIKMPADSVPIDYGANVPTLSPIGSQTLLTFKAGTLQ